jgi:hypothetical membrane protein
MNLDEILRADIRSSLAKSGLLLFLAGFLIFMGIITSEIFYKKHYSTHDNYISELGAPTPPETVRPVPSAAIFNYTLIVTGLMVIIATYFVQKVFRKLIISIPVGLYGLAILGVGIFPADKAPWHGIFALVVFVSGSLSSIASGRIITAPLRYVFILVGVVTLVLLGAYKYFIPYLGAGGTERWVLYPTLFWLTAFGGYLLGIKDEYRHVSHVKQG